MMIDNSAVIEVSCGVNGVVPVMVTSTPAFVLWMILVEDKTGRAERGGENVLYLHSATRGRSRT